MVPITEGKETWLMMLWRTAITEWPTDANDSGQLSSELRAWKESSNITRSLNREESFPRGSLFFLDQSVGVCGANIKRERRIFSYTTNTHHNKTQLNFPSTWETWLWFLNYTYIGSFELDLKENIHFPVHNFIITITDTALLLFVFTAHPNDCF